MEFLSKLGSVRNSTAALVIFFAWYVAASLTIILAQDRLEAVALASTIVLVTGFVFMTLVFLLSRLLKRTDVVDAAWGPAFIVAAIASFISNPFDLTFELNVQSLVTLLVAIWGVRLSYGITRRLLKKPEDARYVDLRKKWRGNEFLNTYLRIFVIQALLATLISSAVIHINLSLPMTIGPFAIIGFIIWAIGFFFEAVGDLQLKKFLSNPANKGKLMTKGLWQYTRHPNYFGEATMWWGISVIAFSTQYGWLTIVTPVVITYLLLFVSGVPITEKAFEGRSGWKTYKSRTSKFVPLPPKND